MPPPPRSAGRGYGSGPQRRVYRRGQTPITADFVRSLETEELEKVKAAVGDDVYAKGSHTEARELFEQVALADDFVEFLTLPAYERIG